ncbi:hypothetical protein AWC38_SpisGene8801 [Stylophora pistillata]|uniref:Uncharacterized protein n=1 Tax=Stylophora pistillata TaxID=50429 RepID=A0A2B4S783_STYPI|nr:hypothetical protein AWC38_SpisGene8801 [Stylophora pistillata]
MEKEVADLNANIKTLRFRVKKTDEILQKDYRAALERHRTSLESVVTAVTTLKVSIEEKKFAEGEDEQAVQEWAEEFEESVDEADKCMRQLASKIELIHRKSKHEAAVFEDKQAIALENEKIEQQREEKERAYSEEIASFEGPKSDRRLPFTAEGYQKTMARRYGKTIEVVGTHVRSILELPTIKEREVRKIHEFYGVLLFNIESLRTLGSLDKLDAAVTFTFDKLGVIKNELAMINEQWSEWSFTQFLEALEKWTLNNPLSEAPRIWEVGKRRAKTRDYFTPKVAIVKRRPPAVVCFAKAPITMQ